MKTTLTKLDTDRLQAYRAGTLAPGDAVGLMRSLGNELHSLGFQVDAYSATDTAGDLAKLTAHPEIKRIGIDPSSASLDDRIAWYIRGDLVNENDLVELQDSITAKIKASGGTVPVLEEDYFLNLEMLLQHPSVAALTPKLRATSSASGRTGGTQASDDGAPAGSLTAQCRASLPKTRYPAGPAPERPEVTGLSAECHAEMQKHRAKN